MAKLNEYCSARVLSSGEVVSGWIIRDKTGAPRYFELEGRGGWCEPYEKVEILETFLQPN